MSTLSCDEYEEDAAVQQLLGDTREFEGTEFENSRPPADVHLERWVELESLRSDARRRVTRAYDTTLRREVILKSLLVSARGDGEYSRLVAATQAMARMSHSGIAKVHGVRLMPNEIVLSTELIVGQTLEAWMQGSRSRTWREVLGALLGAGAGIAKAHSHGLFHGGLHPGNVFITEARSVVTDFGISSKVTDEGSPYLAPEQREGRAADAGSDQYVYCLILWQALCGRLPSEDLACPRRVRVPKRLVDALMRGLAPSPAQRFADMEALLQVLSRVAAGKHGARFVSTVAVPVALTCGAGLTAWQAERAELCSGAAALLGPIWGAEPSARVKQALLATGVSYAPETFTRVQVFLDGYGEAWARHHRDACEATAIRGEQTAAVLDLRMACLQHARVGLQSAVDVLAQADRQVVENAVNLATSLPPLDRCADVEALTMAVPPPANAEDAKKVEAARAELAAAGALELAGKYSDALAQVVRARSQVEDVHYEPVQAEIGFREGTLLDLLGKPAEAEKVLERALTLAVTSGATVVTAQVASRSAVILSDRLHRVPEGRWPATIALAVALGPDGDAASRGDAHNALGGVFLAQGRMRDAEEAFRTAARLREEGLGAKHPLVADSRHNLGIALQSLGRPVEHEVLERQVLEMRKEVLGQHHPRVAETLTNLAIALKDQGRYAEAESCMREAVSIQEAALPPEHPYVGDAYNNLGFLLLRQGHYAEAAQMSRHALERWLRFTPNHAAIGWAYDNLGIGHLRQHQYVEAEQEFRRCLEFRRRVLGLEHRLIAEPQIHLGQALAGRGHFLEARAELEAGQQRAARAFGSDHPLVAEASTALARVLLALHEPQAARAALEQAWKIQSQKPVAPEHRAETAMILAPLLWETDRARARELVAHAKKDYERAGALWQKQASEAQQWLAQHGA